MKRMILALPLVLVAACGSEPSVDMENVTAGEVAEEMRRQGGEEEAFVNPGKWRQTVTLLKIDAPGMPPEAKQMMQKAMDQAKVNNVCLTKEQARSPREDFFAGADQNCRYEHFKWGDGKIDLKLNCKHSNAIQTMTMTGTYEPDSYTMTMDMANQGGGDSVMTMTMKVDAERVGPCDGDEKVQVGN